MAVWDVLKAGFVDNLVLRTKPVRFVLADEPSAKSRLLQSSPTSLLLQMSGLL